MVEKRGIVWSVAFVVPPNGMCPDTLSKNTSLSLYNVLSALPRTLEETS